jgi:hypothetical protein
VTRTHPPSIRPLALDGAHTRLVCVACRSLVTRVLLAAVMAIVVWPAAAAASPGYRIEQRSGETRSVITLSSAGARYELLQPPRRGGRARSKHPTVLVATIIQYAHARELLLDPAQRLFQEVSLTGAVASYEWEAALLSHAGPTDGVGVAAFEAGTKPSPPKALRVPRAHVKSLANTIRIGPLTARAYLLRQGTVRERIWYSTALPLPPAQIRSVLARALRGASAGSTGALAGEADEIPLRIESASGRHWRVVLATTHLKSVSVPARELAAPRGYQRTTQLDPQADIAAHAADVPANPIRCAFVVTCLAGELLSPIAAQPAVWADYWGPHFADHPEVVSAINHGLDEITGDEFASPASSAFWGPLAQYGVGRGKLLGYEIVKSSPGREVGANGVLEVIWFVLSHRWGTNAPKYWWRFWGESPIFAIFVDSEEVNPGGWEGYHAFAPTEGLFFYWLAHPAMPFFVIRVPKPGLEGDKYQGEEKFHKTVDEATEFASHEYVEAATDPYPFTAWADPLKEPVSEDGELADICDVGNTYPWGKETRINEPGVAGGVAVFPFWSNEAQACVPEARPQLRITAPASNSSVFWRSPATFVAEAKDLWEGSPLDDGKVVSLEGVLVPVSAIHWVDEGHGLIGSGESFSTSSLSAGVHHIFVEEEDVTGGFTKTAPVTVTVIARPPSVHIEQPESGSTFPENHLIAFRGSAIDPAQGNIGATATWSVDGVKVGTGASLLLYRIDKEGEQEVTLTATNEAGLSASASIRLKLGPPVDEATVNITSPPAGSYYMNPEEQINFTAQGEGYGGEQLSASAYRWTDVPEGSPEHFLGEGPSITTALGGPSCEIVHHHVTVTVKDGTGHEAHETIEVTVGDIC